MKAQYIFLAAAGAALALSCSELSVDMEKNSSVEGGVPALITATMESIGGEADTKVSFNDPSHGDYSEIWQIGDIIRVSNASSGTTDIVTVKYRVASISAGKATFELVAGEDVSRFSGENKTYYAHYGMTSSTSAFGYISNASGYEGDFKSIITTTPVLKANTVGEDLICIAKATMDKDGKIEFNFKNALCYLKVTMPTPCSLTKLRIPTGLAAANYPTGFCCITMDENGIPTNWRRSSGGSANAAYTPDGGTFQAGATYYLPIWPGRTIAKGKVLECYTGTTHKDIAFPAALTTKRNTIINLGTIVLP